MNHPGAAGVPPAGGLRRAHWLVLAAIVICLALLGGALLYLSPVLALLDNHDPSPGKPLATPAATPPPLDSKQRVNILLLGSDNDGKYSFPALLTQVMMVIHIDTVNNSVSMVSIPRDSWVNVPNIGGMHKIDQAFFLGASQNNNFDDGVRQARLTIEKDYGITIDRYAWVGLSGFSKVIDTLGGVDVDVPHPVLDDNYPNDFNGTGYGTERVYISAGPQHLDGRHTLKDLTLAWFDESRTFAPEAIARRRMLSSTRAVWITILT